MYIHSKEEILNLLTTIVFFVAKLTVKLILDDVVQHLKKVEDEVVIGRLGKQVPSGGEGLWVGKTTKCMYVQLLVKMCQAIFILISLTGA